MKKYLKNNDGMALPMVLIIIMILTMLGASLMLYASQSLRSVRYMDAQKQAYYLARVGVEAGAYAYQSAALKTSSNYDNFTTSAYNGIDAVVSVLQDATDGNEDLVANPGKVTSNRVYVVYSAPSDNSGIWKGLKFVADSSEFKPELYEKVIGYFTVEASAAANTVKQEIPKKDTNGDIIKDENGETVTETVNTDLPVVEFRSTAVCFDGNKNEVKNVVSGFVYPTKSVDSTQIANDNGTFLTDTNKFTEHKTETINMGQSGDVAPDNPRDGFLKRIAQFLKRLWNDFAQAIYNKYVGASATIEIYQYLSGNDLIFSKPKNSDEYKIPNYTSGTQVGYAYAFGTSGTLFLNAGLNVTTDKGKYATIGLFGRDIVVNGDIKMAVYVNNPDYALGNVSNIISTFGNRYRLGTVVIGSGNQSGGEFAEYLAVGDGGITDETGTKVNNANRIFFKGNVTLTVYMQGSKTETYRIFNAGDICLFDGWYENVTGSIADNATDENNKKNDTTYGVDLLKFFVDSVVDGDPNYAHYGEAARKTLSAVREFYYKDQPSYIKKSGNNVTARPLRVIDVNNNAATTTGMSIDGRNVTDVFNGKMYLRYIQEPVASSSSNINWGQPSISKLAQN